MRNIVKEMIIGGVSGDASCTALLYRLDEITEIIIVDNTTSCKN
jgi:hypothetical protein